jgi:hypothetical protein
MNIPFVAISLNIEAWRQFQIDQELSDGLYENMAGNPISRHIPPIRGVKHRPQINNQWEDFARGDQWTRCGAEAAMRQAGRLSPISGRHRAGTSRRGGGLLPQKDQGRG